MFIKIHKIVPVNAMQSRNYSYRFHFRSSNPLAKKSSNYEAVKKFNVNGPLIYNLNTSKRCQYELN